MQEVRESTVTRTIHEPYTNHTRTIHEPYTNHTRTIHEPYTNHTRTIHEPYTNHRQEHRTEGNPNIPIHKPITSAHLSIQKHSFLCTQNTLPSLHISLKSPHSLTNRIHNIFPYILHKTYKIPAFTFPLNIFTYIIKIPALTVCMTL